MRVVLTGFGPFPGAPFNPSARLVEALSRRRRPALTSLDLKTHIFATTYAAVDRDLPKLFVAKPDIVLMFGLAGRRRHLSIETRARNAMSQLFPDAEGYCPPGNVIAPKHASAFRGNAPFMHLLAAARDRAVPARLSRDAGAYLCNYIYWRALQNIQGGKPLVQFVHIPPVRRSTRRRGKRRAAPTLASLINAAEAILTALVAASRH
jgi:pyroglutamyl-peptidase